MFAIGSRVKLSFAGDDPRVRSRTHQSFKKDADINTIVNKYKKTGFLVDPSKINDRRVPHFGDFSDIASFDQIMNRRIQAEQSFIRLPAAVRQRFNNSVQECLEFVSDPANLEESVKLDLLPKEMLPVLPRPVVPKGEGAVAEPPPAGQEPAV